MAKPTQDTPSRNEDEYFAKQDAELIKQMRAKLDKEREQNERKAHFMKCPKCGADMNEEMHGPVKVDICPDCKGMFLDAGEMDLLQKLVDHHVDVLTAILERVGALPDAVLDAPVELSVEWIDCKPLTLRSMCDRLVLQEEMWLSSLRGGPFPPAGDRSAAGLAARHAVAGPSYREFVQVTIDQGRLADTFVDTTADRPRVFTFGVMICHVITFGAVRRTLVLGALESAGVTDLGAGDPMHVLDTAS